MLLMDIICPEPIKDQVERLCIAFVKTRAENLIGIYLHGSLPMGCFNAEQSDIDLLVVIAEPMKVRHALALYRGAARTSDFDAPSVQSFAVTMHRLVRESASSRWARG